MIVKGYRQDSEGNSVLSDIFDIVECTYSGKDMGERSITASFFWDSPIDFQLGDYVELQIQTLHRGNGLEGVIEDFDTNGECIEKFYLYTMPTVKKSARAMEHGKAFEHTLIFYPAQYELSLVQMRDLGNATADGIIYTGFDNVTFYGGAKELMSRIMLVLKEAYHDSEGNALWNFYIDDAVNEEKNDALERFSFTFSGNTVMDALMKLNDKDGINTTFFINGRTIYVGKKRPYFCRAIDNGTIDSDLATQAFYFQYGKTSHETVMLNHGNLFTITKSIGKESPITKLYAYGSSRNLNRYYCSDRLAAGRYVNRVMLPSFANDGKTDYIISEDAAATYGIREGSKQYEDIYPSLRYMTYGDLRQVKYCVKIKASGLYGNIDEHSYNVARVQCYKVIESATEGVNTLVEAAPPDDLAIYVHAVDKVVKVVLCGGVNNESAIKKQLAKDSKIPTVDGSTPTANDLSNCIPGSCFLVHDDGFADNHLEHKADRDVWFTNTNDKAAMDVLSEDVRSEVALHQINYTDTFWLTDLYVFKSYDQTTFSRIGYSAWSYPILNGKYKSNAGDTAHDSVYVNEVVGVEPVVIEDTNLGIELGSAQSTFDIYLRDVGFKIDEQNDFGENVFAYGGDVKVSFLDGELAGREFVVKTINDASTYCVCAYKEDGTRNDEFFNDSGYTNRSIPQDAFDNGAIWRLRCERINLDEPDYSNLNLIMPNTLINASAGDHIVLLDIFMPDIYIKAAENRLLREARKYLAANDRGKVQYSVDLDKVRIQQIPAYALQMREGLNIRMLDDDLNIVTKNRITTIFEGSLQSNVSMYETTYDAEPTTEYYYTIEDRDYYKLEEGGVIKRTTINGKEYIDGSPGTIYLSSPESDNNQGNLLVGNTTLTGTLYGTMLQSDKDSGNEIFAKNGKLNVRILRRVIINDGTSVAGTFYELTHDYVSFNVTNLRVFDNTAEFIAKCNTSSFSTLPLYKDGDDHIMFGVIEYSMRVKHSYDSTNYTPETHITPWGSPVYAPSKILVEFSQYKHYEIVIIASNTDLLYTYPNGNPKFVLMNNLSGDALMYEPSNVIVNHEDLDGGRIKFTLSFDLDGSFNDANDYYPALVYKSDGKTEYVETELISIIESDASGYKDLNYADFTIQDISINIIDSSNRTFAQPIKEISATLSEQSNASAWGSLMNKVEKTVIEGIENNKLAQTAINTGRRHYKELNSLKDSIFDPDGSVTDRFLHTMMLQVGADSMNYYLDKTSKSVDGTQNNYSLLYDNGVCHFKVHEEDVLHHLVYTKNGGRWTIAGNVDTSLVADSDGIYPTYFVAIKCQKFGSNGEWVCDTQQHTVNEEEEYWYFNWGIIVPDDVGVYILTETRGNAYMYGDSLTIGKISDISKRSWFDLTKGEFVLGDKLSFNGETLRIGNSIEASTELSEGVIATGLIELKNKFGVTTAGISGKDDIGDDSYGVGVWLGGTYQDALDQAAKNLHSTTSLLSVLPVLLTKQGIGSKIGCIEVLSSNQVAIYNNDKSSRLLFSATDETGNISIKLQKKLSSTYKNLVIISDDSVDSSVDSVEYSGNPYIETVKEKGEPFAQYIETRNSAVLTSDGWSFNVNSGMFVYLSMYIKTGLEIKKSMYFGSGSYLELIKDGTVIASKDISGTLASEISDGHVLFKIGLFDTIGSSTFNAGTYKIRLNILEYYRTNSVGVTYKETFINKRFTDGSVGFSLAQDVYFTKNSDTDESIIRIGSDGLKVAYSSSSNFIVKNNSGKMDVSINGLPESADEVGAGGLYRSGNMLMIK